MLIEPSLIPVKTVAARVASGVTWLVAWRLATRVMGIGSTLVLVRVLQPADFGLFALALMVTQSAELLSMIGIEDAIIRHATPDRRIYDTAFTLNVLRAVFTAALIAAAALPMARFFDEPRLSVIVLVLSLSTLLGAFENIGMVDYRREMIYLTEFKLRVAPRMVSIAVTVGVAVVFRTYWALVAGILVNRIGGNILSYTFHPYRPRFSLVAWRELTGFSLWVWLIGLVATARDRMEMFVIGRLRNSVEVGIFGIATEIAILPFSEIMQPLQRVLFAGFARSTNDDHASRRLFVRFLALSASVILPAGVGIALVAEPVTLGLLGQKWMSAAPVIQIVGVLSALTSFGFISRSLLEARSILSASFYVTLVTTGVRLVCDVIGVYTLGLIGAAVGVMTANAVEQILFLRISSRLLKIPLSHLVAEVWRPLTGCVVMAAAVIGLKLNTLWPNADILACYEQIATTAIIGAAVYTLTMLSLWTASGRPAGPEADMIAFLKGPALGVMSRLRPR